MVVRPKQNILMSLIRQLIYQENGVVWAKLSRFFKNHPTYATTPKTTAKMLLINSLLYYYITYCDVYINNNKNIQRDYREYTIHQRTIISPLTN